MKFELTIPPDQPQGQAAILSVEAPNWLSALQKALAQTGAAQIPKGKAICEVKEDGSIVVKNAIDGRHFFIKTLPNTHDNPGAVSAPRPRKHKTPYGTMTYLEEELDNMRPPDAERAARPRRKTSKTGAHPCMVFDRSEIQDRLAKHEDVVRKAQERSRSGPPAPGTPNRGMQPVQFIRVVDAPEKRDTLTELRVDLDALRDASDGSQKTGPAVKRAPKGFDWLTDPLDAATRAARSMDELADLALRISLAALPSRHAAFLVKQLNGKWMDRLAVIGHNRNADLATTVPVDNSPFALVVNGSVSMVLDKDSAGPYSSEQLHKVFGQAPESALVAAITSGARTLGAIVLAGSHSSDRYDTGDLAVANYIAIRVFPVLEYWYGATSRIQNRT